MTPDYYARFIVNTLLNIPMIMPQAAGTGLLAGMQTATNAGGAGGLFGLLNLIMAQSATVQPGVPVSENIAAALTNLPPAQKDQLPALLNLLQPQAAGETLTPDEALQKIVTLFKTAETNKTTGVKSTLLGDIAAFLPPAPEQAITPHVTKPELETFIKEAFAAAETPPESKIGQMLQEILGTTTVTDTPDTTEAADTTDTPEIIGADILTQLKAEIAQSGLGTGEIKSDIMTALKAEIAPALEQKGYAPDVIEKHLIALAKLLTDEQPQTAALPA